MKKLLLIVAFAMISVSLCAHNEQHADSSCVETSAQDSLKFMAAMPDMLNLVAHFEGVKAAAYWDPAAKIWTIGIGNTIRPDGKKVTRGDRIKNKKELLDYFSSHVFSYIWEDMSKYLEISKMSLQQIAAVGSLCYNCGSGILYDKKGAPTALTAAINEYVSTGSKAAQRTIKSLMDKKVTSRGKKIDVLVKRRAVEEMVLFGEIIMANNSEFAIENAVDFSAVPLGAAYGIKVGEFGDVKHVTDSINNCRFGRNLNDSIEYAFTSPTPAKKVVLKKKITKK